MKDLSERCTIFITGEVNAGKSSFLNALSGGIVSNVSLQRETFIPIWYQYSNTGTEDNLQRVSMGLESVSKQNQSSRQAIRTLKEEEVSNLLYASDDMNELPVMV
jgi:predicted GTPase